MSAMEAKALTYSTPKTALLSGLADDITGVSLEFPNVSGGRGWAVVRTLSTNRVECICRHICYGITARFDHTVDRRVRR